MAEKEAQSYKVKEGSAIKLLVSSKKGGKEKKFELYRPGDSIKLSPAQALSHQSEIELSDDQRAKLIAAIQPAPTAVFETEPKEKKK